MTLCDYFRSASYLHLIPTVSDVPGTLEMRELSLAIETPAGLLLIAGCSHPGIEKIVEAARMIDQRIHRHLTSIANADALARPPRSVPSLRKH